MVSGLYSYAREAAPLAVKPLGLAMVMVILTACSLSPVASRIPGYLTTPEGELIFNEDGQCWRTASWEPYYAIPQCDPEIYEKQREELAEEEKTESQPKEQQDKEEQTQETAEQEKEETDEESDAGETGDSEPLKVSDIGEVEPEEMVERPLRFGAETNFRFGKARLTAQGKDRIKGLARRLGMYDAEDLSITIVGHTDRLGDAEANRRLSRNRAASVRDVLVDQGISSDVVTVEGKGEQEPLTTLEECPNDINRCELIFCLRKDRRVEISIKGVRRVPADNVR